MPVLPTISFSLLFLKLLFFFSFRGNFRKYIGVLKMVVKLCLKQDGSGGGDAKATFFLS